MSQIFYLLRRKTPIRKIVATVARQLIGKHGKGFVEKSLRRMIQLTRPYSDHAKSVVQSKAT